MFHSNKSNAVSNAIRIGQQLLESPLEVLPGDLYAHGTSTEVLQLAISRNGFSGVAMTDDIETQHLRTEYGGKRVLFVQPTKELPDNKRSSRGILRFSVYHDLSGTSHYLWSKLGLSYSEGRQLGTFFFEYETWYEFVLRTRAAGTNTQLIKLMGRLNSKFGTGKIETWLEEGRKRGGVVLLFKNSIEETPLFDESPLDEFGAKPIILDEPLELKYLYAILPTNTSAAQRLEDLKF